MPSIWQWNGEYLYENFEKYNYYGCNAGSSDSYMFYFAAACSDRHACAAYLCVGSTLCIQTYRRIFLWSAGIFTYPYFQVDFTVTGYPLTFIVMLTVSISVSALMTQIKMQEHVRLKAEKERMRANLLRAVSHDIRTPLTSIEGAAAGIIDNKDVLTEEQKEELLLNIKEEAQWMVRMVENLLSITRMNDEGTRLTTHEELAEEIVSSAVVKFSKRFPDIKVEVDIPEEVVIVPMDPILIRQVIVNIMENAVIHGESTTQVKVTVSANETEAIFSIEDNGKGIDGKILPMLFTGQISHREGETYDNKRSMGIGLSVCKSIIDAHRGKVWAENKIDGGAKISFTLPLEEEEQNSRR